MPLYGIFIFDTKDIPDCATGNTAGTHPEAERGRDAGQFQREWIPLENLYFRACRIAGSVTWLLILLPTHLFPDLVLPGLHIQ